MAFATISRSRLEGELIPPPSKALAWRMVWGLCLGKGGAISNVPVDDDIKALAALAKQFGADVKIKDDVVDVFGPGLPKVHPSYDCKGNTKASRMMIPLSILFSQPTKLVNTDIPRLNHQFLDELSAVSGIRVTNLKDRITIQGPFLSEYIALNNRPGVFWAPAFMMAMPLAKQEQMFFLDDFVSTHPAIKDTLNVFEFFDIDYYYSEEKGVLTIPADQYYPQRYDSVPADWSIGSYYITALLFAGKGEVRLADIANQPEATLFYIFKGVGLLKDDKKKGTLLVESTGSYDFPKEFDPRPYPTLLPLLVLLCTKAKQAVRLGPLAPLSPRSIFRLRHTAKELKKIGAHIEFVADGIVITPSKLTGGEVDARKDGRIAMALTLAGLICQKPLKVENLDGAFKLDPGFFSKLQKIGARIDLNTNPIKQLLQ